MKKFALYVALAIFGVLPGLVVRLGGIHPSAVIDTLLAGLAILSAGFMLSWGVEAAEEHVSRGLAIAVLALITVLPEYVVDMYYAFQAGRHPGSEYIQFAAANMTGANRLLVGFGWPLIVLLYWWRSRKATVDLDPDNVIEISYLALGSLYSFIIVLKGQIDWSDFVLLFGLFAAYLWRLGKLPKENDDDSEREIGPGAALAQLPVRRQYIAIAALTLTAGVVIMLEAEPFAESLIGAATMVGIDKFLLIQWLSPLAGEAPEIVIVVLFTLALRPGYALGALISDKINQWTLLVGTLPIVYSLGASKVMALPLDARQHEEFFLTAAQSLFAVALLLRLRFTLASALILLTLFVSQLSIAFVFQNDEARTVLLLNAFAWGYLVVAGGIFLFNRNRLLHYVRVGVLARSSRVPRVTSEHPDA